LEGTNTWLEHARRWARSNDGAIVVHEEVVDFVQHLVLLHGGESGGAPDDRQIMLWLLRAADHIGKWQSTSDASADEQLIAEQVRASRFNNTEHPAYFAARQK